MRRRLIRFTLLCLLVGAIINVAIAWLMAAWLTIAPHRWQSRLSALPGGQAFILELWREHMNEFRPQLTDFMVLHNVVAPEDIAPRVAFFGRAPTAYAIHFNIGGIFLEMWSFLDSGSVPPSRNVVLQILRTGWPCAAMHGDALTVVHQQTWIGGQHTSDVTARSLLDMSPWLTQTWPTIGRSAGGMGAAVPLSPIWPGFALNTLLYAFIVWVFCGGMFRVRRIIRQRRGQCLRCGYDLRGAAHARCPECGDEMAGSPTKKNGDIASPVALPENSR